MAEEKAAEEKLKAEHEKDLKLKKEAEEHDK